MLNLAGLLRLAQNSHLLLTVRIGGLQLRELVQLVRLSRQAVLPVDIVAHLNQLGERMHLIVLVHYLILLVHQVGLLILHELVRLLHGLLHGLLSKQLLSWLLRLGKQLLCWLLVLLKDVARLLVIAK